MEYSHGREKDLHESPCKKSTALSSDWFANSSILVAWEILFSPASDKKF